MSFSAQSSDTDNTGAPGGLSPSHFLVSTTPSKSGSPSRGQPACMDAASAAASMLHAEAAAEAAEAEPRCDPSSHTPCCGVELDARTGSWIPCQRRSTFASKVHSRGIICVNARDITKVAKCASCSNYAHAYCLVLQAHGGVRQASPLESWTCHSCQESQPTQAKSVKEPAPVYHTLQTKAEILKQLSDANWKCRSSHKKDGRMYFECSLGKCTVKFSAKNQNDDTSVDGGEWAMKNLPSTHACGGSVHKHVSSLVRTQNVLSSEVFKDIQRLACSHCFKSDAIQKFIRSTHSVHVHVKLIANIGYRARQRLFGGNGDLEELLKQQQVADLFI
jgi:hypothetical protein